MILDQYFLSFWFIQSLKSSETFRKYLLHYLLIKRFQHTELFTATRFKGKLPPPFSRLKVPSHLITFSSTTETFFLRDAIIYRYLAKNQGKLNVSKVITFVRSTVLYHRSCRVFSKVEYHMFLTHDRELNRYIICLTVP